MSSNLSIGTATTFVVATAALSLAVDKPVMLDTIGIGWTLRGTVPPADLPATVTPVHAATRKARHLT